MKHDKSEKITKLLKTMRKMNRDAQLAYQQKNGIPKSKIWGGKNSHKQDRANFKKNIRNLDENF
jgi:hypothetical protein